MVDVIMTAAKDGQERDFIRTVRAILGRVGEADLLISPDRERWLARRDANILTRAARSDLFLGEEYSTHNGTKRKVRNAPKTGAKMKLSVRQTQLTGCTFASIASPAMFALHTTGLNPAPALRVRRAYGSIYRQVSRGKDRDNTLSHLGPKVHDELHQLATVIVENEWREIADERRPTYKDEDYQTIVFTDASAEGWGAGVECQLSTGNSSTKFYQQRWVHELADRSGATCSHKQKDASQPEQPTKTCENGGWKLDPGTIARRRRSLKRRRRFAIRRCDRTPCRRREPGGGGKSTRRHDLQQKKLF